MTVTVSRGHSESSSPLADVTPTPHDYAAYDRPIGEVSVDRYIRAAHPGNAADVFEVAAGLTPTDKPDLTIPELRRLVDHLDKVIRAYVGDQLKPRVRAATQDLERLRAAADGGDRDARKKLPEARERAAELRRRERDARFDVDAVLRDVVKRLRDHWRHSAAGYVQVAWMLTPLAGRCRVIHEAFEALPNPSTSRRCCEWCGAPITGKTTRRTCSPAHRQALKRAGGIGPFSRPMSHVRSGPTKAPAVPRSVTPSPHSYAGFDRRNRGVSESQGVVSGVAV